MGQKSASYDLYGVHWFTEGDIKTVVMASDIKIACEQFLRWECRIIYEVIPDAVISSLVKHQKNHSEIIITVIDKGDTLIIKGTVELVKIPKNPIPLCDLVKTSIQPVAVTYNATGIDGEHYTKVIVVDRPSSYEQ
jgi:hypothetical protein